MKARLKEKSKRDIIVMTATRLFKEIGISATNNELISRHTDNLVSAKTIKRLYPSKEHLVVASFISDPEYYETLLRVTSENSVQELQSARLALEVLEQVPDVYRMVAQWRIEYDMMFPNQLTEEEEESLLEMETPEVHKNNEPKP